MFGPLISMVLAPADTGGKQGMKFAWGGESSHKFVRLKISI